jgi:hypothetical protein
MTCEVDELNESENAEGRLYASVREDGLVRYNKIM